MGKLSGKTALVTGSTSGIELGLARGFATAAANLVLNGFGDAGEIEALRSELDTASEGTVNYDGVDMKKPDEIEAMVKGAVARHSAVDILVNNAGVQIVSPIDEFPIDGWDRIIAINMNSALHTARAALPGMKAKGWGRIINIASAHGLCHGKAQNRGNDQNRGAGSRRGWDHQQHHLPRLRVDAASRGLDSGYGESARHYRRPGQARCAACRPMDEEVCDGQAIVRCRE